MKLTIYVKTFGTTKLPEIIEKGDWIDMYVSSNFKTTKYNKGNSALLPLGVAMQLPKGYEAHVLPRSSSFSKFGFIQTNSQGIIDNPYNGDNDEWKEPVYFMRTQEINPSDKICQFRIELSQKATVWQKLKWLFVSGINFVKVDNLGNEDRHGFGSTGSR